MIQSGDQVLNADVSWEINPVLAELTMLFFKVF
jgi:hypothetical protein